MPRELPPADYFAIRRQFSIFTPLPRFIDTAFTSFSDCRFLH
jgi:hypothetical protein